MIPSGQRPMTRTSDTRITGYEPLLAPSALLDQLPLDEAAAATVERSRGEVRAVLAGSCTEQGPAMTSSRSSDPSSTARTSPRLRSTVAAASSPSGSWSSRAEGASSGS